MRKPKIAGIVALLLLTSMAGGEWTDEDVKWWLQSTLPGVCSECPEVIAFYKERLEALDQPRTYPDRPDTSPQEYEEVIPLNISHNIVIYHKIDIFGRPYTYNVTRWVNPPEPTLPEPPTEPVEPVDEPTLYDQVQALEVRIKALETRVEALELICNETN